MLTNAHHFQVEGLDHGEQICDNGALVAFNQTSHASSRDKNQIQDKLEYGGNFEEIIQLDYRLGREDNGEDLIYEGAWGG